MLQKVGSSQNALYLGSKTNYVFSGLHAQCTNTYPCLPVMVHAVRPVQSAVHEQAGNTSMLLMKQYK